MTSDSPIFIFGSPRSGTSLLSQIIGSHSRIGVPFESLLYTTFYPWLRWYGNLAVPSNRRRLAADMLSTDVMRNWTGLPGLEEVLAAVHRPDFHGVFAAIMSTWAQARGKPRWGEKSPWHAFYWREIRAGFPDARIVHIVRDGRDATLSWKRARQGPRHVYPLARRWVDYLELMREVRAAWPARAFLELRYEDLLDAPEQVVRGLCDFLGETFEPGMLLFHEAAVHYPTDPRNRTNLLRPLMQDNKQKWRTRMSPRELRITEAVAGPTLARYGYTPALESPAIPLAELLAIRWLENPPLRAYGMLRNTQGLSEALQNLRIYLRLRLRPARAGNTATSAEGI